MAIIEDLRNIQDDSRFIEALVGDNLEFEQRMRNSIIGASMFGTSWLSFDLGINGSDRSVYAVQIFKDMDSLSGDRRLSRFDALRKEGKKLGEINAILEAEGFGEVSGEGVMPCPTKSHEIVRENASAKKMVKEI